MKHARADYNRIQDPANLIPEDEPVFLLRGQDKFATYMLDHYIELMTGIVGDQRMFDLVRQHRDDMLEWQAEHRVKIPDLPKAKDEVRRQGNVIIVNNGRFVTSFNVANVERIMADSNGGCSVFWKSDQTSNHFDCDYAELHHLLHDPQETVVEASTPDAKGSWVMLSELRSPHKCTVDEWAETRNAIAALDRGIENLKKSLNLISSSSSS